GVWVMGSGGEVGLLKPHVAGKPHPDWYATVTSHRSPVTQAKSRVHGAAAPLETAHGRCARPQTLADIIKNHTPVATATNAPEYGSTRVPSFRESPSRCKDDRISSRIVY